MLLLLNLPEKNKNLHPIGKLLELLHFKTQYIKRTSYTRKDNYYNFYQKETDWIVETEIPIV